MTNRLADHLRNRARSWAGQLTMLAKENAPIHLRKYIHSHVEDKEDGTFIVRTTVDRNENKATRNGSMDARAQEYGSGLRARRGTKAKYPIVPKNGKFLVFQWDVADANPDKFKFTKDGKVILPSVQHPGIQAANSGQGYIAPAQREIRKRAKAELGKDVRDAILGDLRESFGGRVK